MPKLLIAFITLLTVTVPVMLLAAAAMLGLPALV